MKRIKKHQHQREEEKAGKKPRPPSPPPHPPLHEQGLGEHDEGDATPLGSPWPPSSVASGTHEEGEEEILLKAKEKGKTKVAEWTDDEEEAAKSDESDDGGAASPSLNGQQTPTGKRGEEQPGSKQHTLSRQLSARAARKRAKKKQREKERKQRLRDEEAGGSAFLRIF
jgi:hypothetical protein